MVNAGKWLRSFLGGKKDSRTNNLRNEKATAQKKDKRRWTFGRFRTRNNEVGVTENAPPFQMRDGGAAPAEHEREQKKHAMAVAKATVAAEEAAAAAAQAAAVVVRLASHGRSLFNGGGTTEEWGAVKIQTAFRGYLARRALRALKGLVKLQALVRGHIVRKQAAATLRCMQALVRVQARVRARRVRMSEEGQAVQRQLFQRRQHEIGPRRSMDRWKGSSGSWQEIEANNVSSKQVGANPKKGDKAMANVMSDQLRKAPKQNSVVIDGEPDKPHWGWTWLDRWMAARPWESPVMLDELRMSNSNLEEESQAKIVEMDTGKPRRRNGSMSETNNNMATHQASAASLFAHVRPSTAASPRGRLSTRTWETAAAAAAAVSGGDEHMCEASVVSTARSSPRGGSTTRGRRIGVWTPRGSEEWVECPSYMATTLSSNAKARSLSAPKQRPEVSAAARRRLSHMGGGTAEMRRSASQVRPGSGKASDSETLSVGEDFRRRVR